MSDWFRSKIMSHLSLIEKLELSNDAIIQHIKWVSKCIFEIIMSTTWGTEITQEKEMELEPVFDEIFNRIRKHLITILSSENDIGKLEESDLEYIRSTLRIPRLSLSLLKKLLKWELTSDEITEILNIIFDSKEWVDKKDCIDFLLKRLWFPQTIFDDIISLSKWNWDRETITNIVNHFWDIKQKSTKIAIFSIILDGNFLDLLLILELFSNENFKDVISVYIKITELKYIDDINNKFTKFLKWVLESDINIIHGCKNLFLKIEHELTEKILWLIIDDENISIDLKSQLIKELSEDYSDIIASFFWLLGSYKERFIEFMKWHRNLSELSLYKIVSNSPKYKFLLINILFEDFSSDDLQRIIRDWAKEMESSIKDDAKDDKKAFTHMYTERISNTIQDILWIEHLKVWSDKKWRTLNHTSYSFNTSKLEQHTETYTNPIIFLLNVIDLNKEWIKLTYDLNFVEISRIIDNTKTYLWRKLIFDLYFNKIRKLNIEYNEIIDTLLKEKHIRSENHLNDQRFKKIVDENSKNKDFIDKITYISENCKTWWFISVWYSHFIENLLRTRSLSEIKEVFEGLPKENDWDEKWKVNLIKLATIEWRGKKNKYDNDLEKWIIKLEKWEEPKKLQDFLSIDYDVWSILQIFNHFWIDYNEENCKKRSFIMEFFKIKKVKKINWRNVDVNKWKKDFEKIRKNLILLLQILPTNFTIDDFENQNITDILLNFDTEMLELLIIFNKSPKINLQEIVWDLHQEIWNILTQKFLSYRDRIQDEKIIRIVKVLEYVLRNIKIEIDINWIISNKDNPFFIRWNKKSFIIWIIRHILLSLIKANWNKFTDLRTIWVISWSVWDMDLEVNWDINIDYEDLVYIWNKQAILAWNDNVPEIVWEYIYKMLEKKN